jgi:hypothetical protein
MPSLFDPGQQNQPGGLLGLAPRIQQPDDSGTDQGAALAQTYNAVLAEIQRQQQISADRGLWNPSTGMPTSTGLLDAARQTANAIMMGTTAPESSGGSPFEVSPAQGRQLPSDNYLKPLSTHAPFMFREAAPAEAAEILPGQYVAMPGVEEKFVADHPDIALGQGENAGGVQLAFDASKLQGQLNRTKPAWQLGYQNGAAEYVAKNTTGDYRDALVGIRVPDSLDLTQRRGGGAAVNIGLNRLLSKGWSKQTTDSGYTEYLPPTAP